MNARDGCPQRLVRRRGTSTDGAGACVRPEEVTQPETRQEKSVKEETQSETKEEQPIDNSNKEPTNFEETNEDEKK